jgi:hypothetical protein
MVRGRNLIDVGSGLDRGLKKHTAPPLSKMLALLSGHLSLRCQVHLVGNQHYIDKNIYELPSNGQGKAAITLYMSLSTNWRRLRRIDLFHLADLAAKSIHLETVPQLRTRTVEGNTQQRRKRFL